MGGPEEKEEGGGLLAFPLDSNPKPEGTLCPLKYQGMWDLQPLLWPLSGWRLMSGGAGHRSRTFVCWIL